MTVIHLYSGTSRMRSQPQLRNDKYIMMQDKDLLRFLWVNDPYPESPKLLVFRFLCVIFGLNCSSFLLGASLNHHIKKYESEDPTFVRALLESCYAYDTISGDNQVKSAFELYMKSKLSLADRGFNLRKWRSSSLKLMTLIEANEANEIEYKRPELIEAKPFVEDETSSTKGSVIFYQEGGPLEIFQVL